MIFTHLPAVEGMKGENVRKEMTSVFKVTYLAYTSFLQRGVDGSKGGLMKALLLVPCVNR